jgi:hypothetical protein
MLVRLTEAFEIPANSTYGLREVSINPEHVTALRYDGLAKSALNENRMPPGLSKTAEFTRVYMNNGLNVLVVGSPDILEQKFSSQKTLLKG